MEKAEIKEKAEQMTGKRFVYEGKTVKVESHRITDKSITLHTDKLNIPIPFSNFENEIEKFVQPEIQTGTEIAHIPTTNDIRPTVIGSSAMELKNILMDNIRKVQGNKEYIPQAIEVNNNVKSIIDLAKAEVELIKAMSR